MAEYTAKSFMFSEAFAREIAAAFKTVPSAALMAALEVHLIKDPDFAPNPQHLTADYGAVQADFTDYVQKTATLTEPANLGNNIEGAVSTVTWNMTTDPAVASNQIYGYWCEVGTVVVGAEKFPDGQSIIMAEYGDYFTLNLKLPVMSYQDVE